MATTGWVESSEEDEGHEPAAGWKPVADTSDEDDGGAMEGGCEIVCFKNSLDFVCFVQHGERVELETRVSSCTSRAWNRPLFVSMLIRLGLV
jgi:hypothetical protein